MIVDSIFRIFESLFELIIVYIGWWNWIGQLDLQIFFSRLFNTWNLLLDLGFWWIGWMNALPHFCILYISITLWLWWQFDSLIDKFLDFGFEVVLVIHSIHYSLDFWTLDLRVYHWFTWFTTQEILVFKFEVVPEIYMVEN